MPTLEPLLDQRLSLRTDDEGTVRVGLSRVTFDTVVGFYEEGASPEEICLRFPSLILSDVYGAISYYLAHRTEVQLYLQARRDEAESLRRKGEALCPEDDLRARLLARRSPATNRLIHTV